MRVNCTTTFMDGRDRFEAGEPLATESGCGCRVITQDQAERFVAAGWASADGESVSSGATTADLQINNGQHGHKAANHG